MHLATALSVVLMSLALAMPHARHEAENPLVRRGLPGSPPGAASTSRATAARGSASSPVRPNDRYGAATAPEIVRVYPPGTLSLPDPYGAYHPVDNPARLTNPPPLEHSSNAQFQWIRPGLWQAQARPFANNHR
ncbi:hypothetical protein XA68_13914 [Ophiocordyceps unilateralis]|uniref:Yeast cell wall synthesis Kre9/Knh1 C-terminal domain-containing protein n=1 Tax=Ophiocordyceps unilateralis TaxID=268505 RepID=A0A2A9PAF6_OPHUN|nr:hypothetical protein XA68_13914 [Ophiocordyceps unilateralis]